MASITLIVVAAYFYKNNSKDSESKIQKFEGACGFDRGKCRQILRKG